MTKKTPELETLSKPPQEPDISNPEFLGFANAGAKADEPLDKKAPPKKKRFCLILDEDIDAAIQKECSSRRTKLSKTQWIIKAILTKLRWRDKA